MNPTLLEMLIQPNSILIVRVELVQVVGLNIHPYNFMLGGVWKPLISGHILKTLSGSRKGKAQRGQYRLAAGLGCYNEHVRRIRVGL